MGDTHYTKDALPPEGPPEGPDPPNPPELPVGEPPFILSEPPPD